MEIIVLPTILVQQHTGNGSQISWFVHATDLSDGELKEEVFCVRFVYMEVESVPHLYICEIEVSGHFPNLEVYDVRVRLVELVAILAGRYNLTVYGNHFRRVWDVDLKHDFAFVCSGLIESEFFVDENSQLKAIDFGLSDFVKPDKRLNDIVGSAYYVASEVLHRSYNTEADVILGLVTTMIFKLMKAYMRSSSLHKAALRALSNLVVYFLLRMSERRDLPKLLTISPLLDKNVKVETPQKLGADGKKGGDVRRLQACVSGSVVVLQACVSGSVVVLQACVSGLIVQA
ncbi:hypothetical protein C5167_028907 [Papaver somniferum]|nr:hypothetical protein C5167_028907 [Papaver somniferum]